MRRFERHNAILRQVQQDGGVSLNALIDTLQHSAATIRRDLVDLERGGKLVRTHGGAVYPQRLALEASFSERKSRCWAEKERIGGRILADIPEGATVFVDAGTTCLEAGVRLLERGRNQLFTHSIPLLVVGCSYPGKIVGLGGEVRSVSRALVGSFALDWLQKLRFDYALLGASALDGGSVRTTEIHEAALKAAAKQHADKTFLLADAAKCEDSAPVEFLKLSDLNAWYVDNSLSARKAAYLSRQHHLPIIRC